MTTPPSSAGTFLMRFCIVVLAVITLLANSLVMSRAQAPQVALSQANASAQLSVRIMPPDGSAFLVGQRFDIRVEGPPNASGAIKISLDGNDISDWNNRSHLTGSQLDHSPSP